MCYNQIKGTRNSKTTEWPIQLALRNDFTFQIIFVFWFHNEVQNMAAAAAANGPLQMKKALTYLTIPNPTENLRKMNG